ncbi:MAG TPA: transglycosylase SLT domain-containing protein [Pyrinomonadaceae bacterium]|nr:transglycosylase SLT domain-containing protein [Pyrinomonadaceae bacterium]
MSGIDRINRGIQPITEKGGEVARRERPLVGGRDRRTSFEKGLSADVQPARTEREGATGERGAALRYLTDEAWARQRTLEELKTLVQAIQAGVTDPWQLTDLIFYARHPEMIGQPLTKEQQPLLDEWNAISALLVHPALNEVGDFLGANVIGGDVRGAEGMGTAFERATNSPLNERRLAGGSTRAYDDVIARAVEWCPGLSPAILKGLLAQESNFNPTVINQYGYAGIAQFGREAAREVGLHVGIAGSAGDERLNPAKAIPGAARLLNLKAQRLGEMAFSRYGQPNGVEFWKFVLAAYNGGEGTVALAMGNAYRVGMAKARAQGLVGADAVGFARNYASKWENLKVGGADSPLALAAARYFPTLAAAKFQEIGNYPTAIVSRALGSHLSGQRA